jgi:agmatinase
MAFIVKIPGINGLGKTNGCEKAGNEIIKELRNISVNEQGREIEFNKLELEEIHVDNGDVEKANDLIYQNSFEIFEENPKVIFLGGDHSISYSLTRAFFDFCENSGKEPCLIVFDAHADCDNPNKEPTHEEWLRKLVEDGFPVENILLIGVRKIWKNEMDFIKKKGIKIISMEQLRSNIEDSCDIIMEFTNGKELYVSIDVDVIDPAFAPATGYPEIGGLSSREFIYLIQRINKMKNLRAVDIVEINPLKDRDNLTIKLGAKILSELV